MRNQDGNRRGEKLTPYASARMTDFASLNPANQFLLMLHQKSMSERRSEGAKRDLNLLFYFSF